MAEYILAGWLIVIAVLIYRIWRPRRKPSYLADRYAASASARRAEEMKGLKGMGRGLSEFTSQMTYGSPSYKTWKLNCDASLHASQRRRGLRPEEES